MKGGEAMQIIEVKRKRTLADEVPSTVLSALPYRLIDEIRSLWTGEQIEEIRVRRGRRASLTLRGRNIILKTVLDGSEIDSTLTGMCSGSLYAYSDTINRGYISLPGGVRIGVCAEVKSHIRSILLQNFQRVAQIFGAVRSTDMRNYKFNVRIFLFNLDKLFYVGGVFKPIGFRNM